MNKFIGKIHKINIINVLESKPKKLEAFFPHIILFRKEKFFMLFMKFLHEKKVRKKFYVFCSEADKQEN